MFLRDFIERHYSQLRPNTLIYEHIQNCKDIGLKDDKIKANLIGPILISASNTMGISSAFFLRNLIRYPDVRRRLQDNPALPCSTTTLCCWNSCGATIMSRRSRGTPMAR